MPRSREIPEGIDLKKLKNNVNSQFIEWVEQVGNLNTERVLEICTFLLNLLICLIFDYAKNVPKGKEDYKRHKNLNEYLVVFNPASELFNFVHSLEDNYNLRNLILQ